MIRRCRRGRRRQCRTRLARPPEHRFESAKQPASRAFSYTERISGPVATASRPLPANPQPPDQELSGKFLRVAPESGACRVPGIPRARLGPRQDRARVSAPARGLGRHMTPGRADRKRRTGVSAGRSVYGRCWPRAGYSPPQLTTQRFSGPSGHQQPHLTRRRRTLGTAHGSGPARGVGGPDLMSPASARCCDGKPPAVAPPEIPRSTSTASHRRDADTSTSADASRMRHPCRNRRRARGDRVPGRGLPQQEAEFFLQRRHARP